MTDLIGNVDVTATSAVDQYGIGNVWEDYSTKKAYRWVKFVDAIDGVEGYTVQPASVSQWDVTCDRAGGSGLSDLTVGICLGAVDISEAPYAWVQIAGIANVYSDGSVAAGEFVTTHATVNGQVDTMADGREEAVFGVALDADASGTAIASVVSCHVLLNIGR